MHTIFMDCIKVVKMSSLPIFFCKFNLISIESQQDIFIDLEKLILKFISESNGTRRSKTTLKRKIIKLKESSYPT